jgi:hypothetical protein
MSPLLNGNFLGFVNYLKNKNYEHFCLVKDTVTGKVVTSGNSGLALQHLNERNVSERRESREWIPEKEIIMSKPFAKFVNDTKEVRTFASYLVQHFLGQRQRIGQVRS